MIITAFTTIKIKVIIIQSKLTHLYCEKGEKQSVAGCHKSPGHTWNFLFYLILFFLLVLLLLQTLSAVLTM